MYSTYIINITSLNKEQTWELYKWNKYDSG